MPETVPCPIASRYRCDPSVCGGVLDEFVEGRLYMHDDVEFYVGKAWFKRGCPHEATYVQRIRDVPMAHEFQGEGT